MQSKRKTSILVFALNFLISNLDSETEDIFANIKPPIDDPNIEQELRDLYDELAESLVVTLPTIKMGAKTYFVDERLGQIRNVDNPHDYHSLDDIQSEDIEYVVLYRTTVKYLPSEQSRSDAISEIDIPENETCKYIADSFDLVLPLPHTAPEHEFGDFTNEDRCNVGDEHAE